MAGDEHRVTIRNAKKEMLDDFLISQLRYRLNNPFSLIDWKYHDDSNGMYQEEERIHGAASYNVWNKRTIDEIKARIENNRVITLDEKDAYEETSFLLTWINRKLIEYEGEEGVHVVFETEHDF
jgi:hypothetical protein